MLRILILLLVTTLASQADDLHAERVWTGTNGKTIRGTFSGLVDNDRKVEIVTDTGKQLRIALENLCDKDRRLLAGEISFQPTSTATGDASVFQPSPTVNRQAFTLIDNGEGLDWQSGPYAVGSHLLWWNSLEWIPISRRGDLRKKAIWVNKEIRRTVSPRGTNASTPNSVMQGFAEYFRENHKDTVTWRCHYCFDQNLETFRHYAQGPAACVIYTSTRSYGYLWPLLEVTDQGVIKLAYRDKIIEATWSATEEMSPNYSYELEIPRPDGTSEKLRFDQGPDPRKTIGLSKLTIRDTGDLPSWITEEGLEHTLNPIYPMVVFRPYPAVRKGELPPPPPDPLFDDAPDAAKAN